MTKIYIAEASRRCNLKINQQLENDREELKRDIPKHLQKYCKDHYILIHQKSDTKDDTGENYYNVGLYKQTNWFFVRGEDDLKEILDFIKKQQKKTDIYIMDADKMKEGDE